MALKFEHAGVVVAAVDDPFALRRLEDPRAASVACPPTCSVDTMVVSKLRSYSVTSLLRRRAERPTRGLTIVSLKRTWRPFELLSSASMNALLRISDDAATALVIAFELCFMAELL